MEITSLTQEQQWGLAYLVQVQNDQIEQQNANIVQQNKWIEENNKRLPRDTELQPLIALAEKQTVDSFVAGKVAELGNQGYSQLMQVKEQQALAMFRNLPPEQQAALVAQFQIPDVLKT